MHAPLHHVSRLLLWLMWRRRMERKEDGGEGGQGEGIIGEWEERRGWGGREGEKEGGGA